MLYDKQEARQLIINCLRIIQTNPAKILKHISYDEDTDDLNRRIGKGTAFEMNMAGRLIFEKILPESILDRVKVRSLISIDHQSKNTGLAPTQVHTQLSHDLRDDIEDKILIEQILDDIKDPTDRKIMQLYLTPNKMMSLREIGDDVGLSHEQVRKRLKKVARTAMDKFIDVED